VIAIFIYLTVACANIVRCRKLIDYFVAIRSCTKDFILFLDELHFIGNNSYGKTPGLDDRNQLISFFSKPSPTTHRAGQCSTPHGTTCAVQYAQSRDASVSWMESRDIFDGCALGDEV
jgi:hypothetical protein